MISIISKKTKAVLFLLQQKMKMINSTNTKRANYNEIREESDEEEDY
jgi:hypothetical protein